MLVAAEGNTIPAEVKLMTVGTSCNPGCMVIFGRVPVGEGCLLASAVNEVQSLGSLIERLLLGTHSLAELRASGVLLSRLFSSLPEQHHKGIHGSL